MWRRLFVGAATVVAFGGCTFGGLADYEIASCEPKPSQASDECNRLNTDPGTCTPYQCDPATRRCIQRSRDDDHDGDPSETCGGTDCADGDAQRSGRHAAPPLQVFAGEIAADADLSLVDTPGGDPAAVFRGSAGRCIQVVRLKQGGGPFLVDCTLLRNDTSLGPRQPFARILPGGVYGAFVAKTGCTVGRVGFAFAKDVSFHTPPTLAACGPGAALPSVGIADSGATLVAWFQTAVDARRDPVDACATAGAAPLYVARVTSPTSAPSIVDARKLTGSSPSVRPAAIAAVGDRFLIAAPDGDAATIWVVDEKTTRHTHSLPELVGARAVSLAVHQDGGSVRFAAIAELGCTPQTIAAVVGTLNPADDTISILRSATIAEKGAGLAVQPSIAWNRDRGGWSATWVTRSEVRARRLGDDGSPLADAYALTTGATAALVTGSARAFVFRAENPASGKLFDAALRCP